MSVVMHFRFRPPAILLYLHIKHFTEVTWKLTWKSVTRSSRLKFLAHTSPIFPILTVNFIGFRGQKFSERICIVTIFFSFENLTPSYVEGLSFVANICSSLSRERIFYLAIGVDFFKVCYTCVNSVFLFICLCHEMFIPIRSC